MQEDRASHEAMLRRAVLSGEQQAWRRLYDESCEAVFRFALWRCGNRRELAEEVVQEAWLTAVRRIDRFEPERGSFVDWTRGIVANVIRNHLRRDRTRRLHVQSLNGKAESNGHAKAAMQRQRQAEQIAQALAALPEHYEAVLRAKYVECYSVSEIAQRRSETEKAVESMLSRAREAFRKEYRN